jgi:hypothetical protein
MEFSVSLEVTFVEVRVLFAEEPVVGVLVLFAEGPVVGVQALAVEVVEQALIHLRWRVYDQRH